MSHTCLQPPAA